MKKIRILFVISLAFIALGAFATSGLSELDNSDKKQKENISHKTTEECIIPTYAKVIGHSDLWLKHNGCPPRKKIPKNTLIQGE